MNGQFDTAITYAERAIALDPAIAANVRRLMPGLISEG
jgi:hypothetical protein